MQAELDEIRRVADLPRLLDLETEETVFSHKSLFAKPAHVHVENDEPQDYERCASAGAFVPRSVHLNLIIIQDLLSSVTKCWLSLLRRSSSIGTLMRGQVFSQCVT